MEARDYLQLNAIKNTKGLSVSFLEMLEDIQFQHDEQFYKLMLALPPEYKNLVVQANFFDKEAYAHFRKRVLDHAGAATRNLQEELDKFSIAFKH